MTVVRLFAISTVLVTTSMALAAPCKPIDAHHDAWTKFLGDYVKHGLVDYAAIKHDGARRLNDYLDAAAHACPAQYATLETNDKLAFWINVYNAAVIKLVVDHYPLDSIRSLVQPDAFKRDVVTTALEPKPLSLDAIENQIIRARFKEPRVHFALVCAAVSCPQLRPEAYRGAMLDEQLDDQARLFLTDTQKNRYDEAAKTLYVSSIFDWFKDDFAQKYGSVRRFLGEKLGVDATRSDVELRYSAYDWRINTAPKH